MTYIAVWEFHVKPNSVAEFERVYGPDGSWSQLFRKSFAYRGTDLLRDADRAGRYLTIDRWTSRAALQQFKQQYQEEYAALDTTCERMTASEAKLGDFESTSSV